MDKFANFYRQSEWFLMVDENCYFYINGICGGEGGGGMRNCDGWLAHKLILMVVG